MLSVRATALLLVGVGIKPSASGTPKQENVSIFLVGHTDDVDIVVFSQDGRKIASGSQDNTVRLWDAETGEHLKTLVGHWAYIITIAFSPDGTLLASGSEDDTVRLWDGRYRERLGRRLWGHFAGVETLAFNHDGTMFASGSRDAVITLWDTATGDWVHFLFGHRGHVLTVAFNPAGTILASGGWDNTLRLWDVATGEEITAIEASEYGVESFIESVAFSHDGKTLAAGGWGNTIGLWDVATGEHIETFTGHTSRVESVAFNSDSTVLASGSRDGTVLLWDIPQLPPEPVEPPPPLVEDVNGNGVVNILDLALVGLRLGQTGENSADVNGDGVVDIVDLVQVAGAIANVAAAPAVHPIALTNLTSTDIEGWLTQAQALDLTDVRSQRGILFLEQLLVTLDPKETALLPNFPNPFNPETWIPYQLANDADVTLIVYDTEGTPVRQFDLGHQSAGFYTTRMKAAYWDGRNEKGESVASGVYFYQLQAGDYTDLRRMVILK